VVQGLVDWEYHLLSSSLIANLSSLKTYRIEDIITTPFLKSSLYNVYANCEFVIPKVEPNPTFRLVTQAVTRVAPRWFGLGPQLGKSSHLNLHLEGHVRRLVKFPSLLRGRSTPTLH
jgi:hypothetical protein